MSSALTAATRAQLFQPSATAATKGTGSTAKVCAQNVLVVKGNQEIRLMLQDQAAKLVTLNALHATKVVTTAKDPEKTNVWDARPATAPTD